MAQPLQTKLLRVLQERQVRRVGDTKSSVINVRVVAATNESLQEKIRAGGFREDLYYRLAVIPLEMPPLRSRLEDVPLLVKHFLQKNTSQSSAEPKEIAPEALDLLGRYAWPGNVRELENAIERACALCDDGIIRPRDLPPKVLSESENFTGETGMPIGQRLEDFVRNQERHYIEQTLKFNGGNREKTATMLGVSMATLYRKLEVKKP